MAGNGVIQMLTGPETARPLTVKLYSRPVSSRLSYDPLCLYFRYHVVSGTDGRLNIYTVDNADESTVQWSLHGHSMQTWQFGFVQINTAGGPFQVVWFLFTSTELLKKNVEYILVASVRKTAVEIVKKQYKTM